MENEAKDSEEKDEEITINTKGLKKSFGRVSGFLGKKEVMIGLAIILFLFILITSTSLRLSNLPAFKDSTSGNYVFADPDAFYEFRVAQTIVSTGDISGIDAMRSPGLNLPYTQEMLPKVLALAYNVLHPLNSMFTLDYIDVIYPVVAFAVGLIFFFVLCWYLTKSKLLSLLASAMLAYSSVYLGRTGAGISSHEALGMVFFFLALLVFAFSMNNYKKNWKWSASLGVATGVALSLTLFSWSGGSNFVLMIFSFFMITYYLFNMKDAGKEDKIKFFIFNLAWITASVVFMPLFGYSLGSMYLRFLNNYGLLVPFTMLLMIIDFGAEKYSHKMKILQGKYRIISSLVITALLGLLSLTVMGKNPFNLLYSVYFQLIYPLGQERVGLTVAYYSQPYLSDIIGDFSSIIFWLFFLGLIAIAIQFGKDITSKKHKIYFYLIWILTTAGMLFSRFSGSSVLDGASFISQVIYISSFLIMGIYLLFLSMTGKMNLSTETIFLFSWMIVMMMSIRSAVRVIFVVAIFIFFSAALFTIKSYEYAKKTKDELLKYLLYFVFIISLLAVIGFAFGNPLLGTSGEYQTLAYSSAHQGPLTDSQWQNAMSWVRDNTASNSVFAHWWDYGYLVQTLGNRTTIVDGGNPNVYWDHLIARYLLTTPTPETAYSFMKAHNASYLLIDPTDVGKYPAFSKIGSDDSGMDRFSIIPVMLSNSSEIVETRNSQIRLYQGGTILDEDISYNTANGTIFLPQGKAYMGAVGLEYANKNGTLTFKQPYGIFVYNQKQINIPLRYLYYQGQIIDFKGGLEGVLDIIPGGDPTNTGGITIDPLKAGIYLSPKTTKSLFGQLYILNDAFHNYKGFALVHSESDSTISYFRSQGVAINDFFYIGGLMGPLKIWKVTVPSNIGERQEFLNISGEYAGLDNLTFSSG